MKMSENVVFSGYLDVKVSSKSRRGFTPWKAWHKRRCDIIKLDKIESGAELTFKSSTEGSIINRIILPRSSTVCRIESRSKLYAFGIFTAAQKPLLFLAENSERDAQKWMEIIRKILCIASYIAAEKFNYYVSLVDNNHSRSAGLVGLFGILTTNPQEIIVGDPITGEAKARWNWHQFHQFHLQAAPCLEDQNTICVFHTNSEFASGPGQLHFFCEEAPWLLELLVSRGKTGHPFATTQRLSQSEGDLSASIGVARNLKNLSNSDDSGVRVLLSVDECDCQIDDKYLLNTVDVLSKTPGGSEADEEDQNVDVAHKDRLLPRGESGISLSSGVYEEIPETLPLSTKEHSSAYCNGRMFHLYEDPAEVSKVTTECKVPPPLPPRLNNLEKNCDTYQSKTAKGDSYKFRSNTLPSKDLRRLSENFTADSDYMVMVMPKRKHDVPEGQYVPMSSVVSLKSKIEGYYMAMSGVKKC